MGKKVLVDTDIIIKSYRGDKIKYQQLGLIKDAFFVSVITTMELLNGARNFKQLTSTRKELKAYNILHLNDEISIIAFQLYSKHSVNKFLRIPDLLIAATSLHYNLELYTDNKSDYTFIKGISFYKEK